MVNYETAWCPGCGNFQILPAVKKALAASDLAPHQVTFISGIGQAAKAPHYLNANLFNGLHGRALPVATGCRLANHTQPVIVESGDGCNYGEGGNHFLAAIRRNLNVVMLVHDNQVYGLDQGAGQPDLGRRICHQSATAWRLCRTFSSPGSGGGIARRLCGPEFRRPGGPYGQHDQSSPDGIRVLPWWTFCSHVFLLISSIPLPGTRIAVIPCRRSYDPTDWTAAMQKAIEWGDKIPVGVIYKNNRPAF